MNLLPATIKEIGIPYFHESSKLWIVEIKYHCYGEDDVFKIPYKTKELALNHGFKVGNEIYI